MIALTLLLVLILYGLAAWCAIRMLGWLGRICVFPSLSTKVAQGLTLAFFVLFPTWDIIPSRLYFEHLCETEAGVKAFKIIELDQSYFRADGRPDDRKLLDRYAQSSKRTPNFSRWAHITKVEGAIQDKETDELLGSSTDFSYYGGWVEARIAPMSPITCPALKAGVFGMGLKQVFKLKQTSLQERN